MTNAVDLAPPRFAALVGPAVTRAFTAGMHAGRTEGRELVLSYGGQAVGYLIDLRNPLAAGRSVSRDGLAAVYRYADPGEVDETVQRSVDHGLLSRAPAGEITATERGQAFLRDLFALHARVLTERWGQEQNGPVERLNTLVARILAQATATSGDAWAVHAPPYEPRGTPSPVLLLNRLSTLRIHRADAHAAAWQRAGLSAAEMVAMPWGSTWSPRRQAVEDETNRRAASPYAVLTPDERLTMLADLAMLP
ncbi:hypothetical protein ABN034_20450 [Actinopolymorpha sp. B11F2]|uniref:hypothetical protein n=1 Tax=Actinopolymorpha sp. B11F2 TaxID=3160862 RepID=UPI0032E40BEE